MSGNILLLKGAAAGATSSSNHVTYGADTNGRFYQTDLTGLVLYFSARQVLPFASSTATTTLTFGANANDLTATVNVTGSSGTRNIVVNSTDRIANDKIEIRINAGSTAGVILNIRDGNVGGAILTTFTTDGSGTDNAFLKLKFDGTNWSFDALVFPTI